MRKIFTLTLLILVLTACGNTEVSKPGGSIDIDETVQQRGVDINSGTGQITQVNPENFVDPNSFEDLLSQYNQALIKTSLGNIKVGFYNDLAPLAVNSFMNLSKTGYYDNTKVHMIIQNLLIAAGDPNTKDDDPSNDGQGGPGYIFNDEIGSQKFSKGSLGMLGAAQNANGSQFFIITAESAPTLDGSHTNFGHVIEGMYVVDKIAATQVENGRPLEDILIYGIDLLKGADIEPTSLETTEPESVVQPEETEILPEEEVIPEENEPLDEDVAPATDDSGPNL